MNFERKFHISPRLYIAGIAVIFLVIFLIIALFRGQKHEKVDTKRTIDYTVRIPSEISTPVVHPLEMEVSAVVEGWRHANVVAKSSGTVSRVNSRGLTFLPKGYSLLSVKKNGSNSAYDQAQSLYENSKINLETVSKLYDRKLASKAEYLSAKASFSQARSTLLKAAEMAGNRLVKVPYDAWVSEVTLEKGSFLSPGVVVAQAYDISRLKITASIPLIYFGYIAVGQRIRLDISDSHELALRGRVTLVDAQVNENTQTFSIQIQVPNPKKRLVPINSRVRVKIDGPKMSFFETDLSSVTIDGKGHPAVFTVDKESKAKKVSIVIWQTGGEKISFFLPEDSKRKGSLEILTLGSSTLNEGDSVKVTHPKSHSKETSFATSQTQIS